MKYSPHSICFLGSIRARLILLVLLCGLAHEVSAAELNITANQLPLRLGPYLDFYEDTSAELSIEDLLARDIPWQRSEQSIPTMGISTSAFWFLIELNSRQSIAEALVLSSDVPVADRLEF